MFALLDSRSSPRRFLSLFVGISGFTFFVVAAFLVPALHSRLPESGPIAATDAERRVLATMEEAANSGELYANVGSADGRMLRLLVESTNAKRVVEIGTSTGISGLWLCMGLTKTGGTLHTFELDSDRAATARRHFLSAGVSSMVNLVEGDAHKALRALDAPIDLVFIDAEKQGYVDYLNQLLPRMRPGGLILAHNVNMVPEYVSAVTGNPELETVFYMRGGGLAITLKKM